MAGDGVPVEPVEKGRRRGRPNVVVITGASAGVGRAVARRFARDGASVALLARGRDAADVAITTTFGPNTLQSFRVWTGEIAGSA